MPHESQVLHLSAPGKALNRALDFSAPGKVLFSAFVFPVRGTYIMSSKGAMKVVARGWGASCVASRWDASECSEPPIPELVGIP